MKTSALLVVLVLAGCAGSDYTPSKAYDKPNPNAPFANPRPDDIYQTGYGDCWLMAELAAFAFATPQVITNAITVDSNGDYTVRFFDYDNNDKEVFVKVSLNDIDPNNTSISVNDNGQPSYWSGIIETAYGKWAGHDALNKGGQSSTAYELMTGEKATDMFVFNLNDKSIYGFLLSANNNIPVTMAVDKVSDTDTDIQNSHEYTVLHVAGSNAVTIRNPWGIGPPAHRNGIENVSVSFIKKNFIYITVPDHTISGM